MQRRIQEASHILHSRAEGGGVRRRTHGERKPAVADHGAQRHFDVPLRAEHQEAAARKVRRQSQQVHRVRAPAVQSDDRRVRAIALGFVECVEEVHPDTA